MIVKKKINENFKGLIIILIAFLVSSNIAWLNPAPGKESYQPYKDIPIFWQYNYDSGIEILTAAYFPKIFYKDTTRIDRPTYPIIANIIGKGVCVVICNFYKLSELEKAGIGYIALKIIIFSLSLFLLNEILVNFFTKNEIFLSNLLIFFSVISIGNIATFHTIELQFITPIIVSFLFLNISNNYSVFKNICFSIIVGILMLGKPNYAIYLSILVFCFLNKRIIETLISFLCHLIPLAIYNFYLNSISLKFTVTGMNQGQGTWIIGYLMENDIYEFFMNIMVSFYKYLYLIYDNYSFWIILSFLGLYLFRKNVNLNFYVFLGIFVFFNWLQIFVSDRYKTYMTSDLMIVVYPLATVGFFYLLEKLKYPKFKSIIFNILFLYIVFTNLMAYVNFPLIHPYDQPAKNSYLMSEKMKKLTN